MKGKGEDKFSFGHFEFEKSVGNPREEIYWSVNIWILMVKI